MADRFWNPSAAANWADANTWAATDGGTPNQATPTSADNVYFTSTNVNNCTIGANAICLNLDSTGGTGYTGTLAFNQRINIYGSITLSAGMGVTVTAWMMYLYATSTGKTITSAGKILPPIWFYSGTGGWTLQDDLNTAANELRFSNGSLICGAHTITCGLFNASSSTTRALNISGSTINCNDWTAATVTGLTFTNDASTVINVLTTGTFAGGGLTYLGTTNLNTTSITISGSNTFNVLTRNGTAAKTDTLTLPAGTTQTITTANFIGNSAINRLLVQSSTLGTAATLTVTNWTGTVNCDFMDITSTNAANLSAITGGSGNCGGNTNFTFTTSATMYWHVDSGNFSNSAKWFLATNGGGGAGRTPLPQDDLNFDANSFDSASQTVTADMIRMCRSINFTGATNSPTLGGSYNYSIYGSITLISAMTISVNTLYLRGRGSFNITSNTKSLRPYIYAPNGTYTLQDALNSAYSVFLYNGTFNANNQNVTVYSFNSNNNNIRTLTMGLGTWILTSYYDIWNILTTTNLTFNKDTATIKFTNNSTNYKTFKGGGLTYYNFWNATAGTGPTIIYDTNTFNDFKIDAGRIQQFTAGITTTVTTFTAIGASGNEITIQSSTAAAHNLSCASGTIEVDYCAISYSQAAGGAIWNASVDRGNTNSGNNTGWDFSSGAAAYIPQIIMIT